MHFPITVWGIKSPYPTVVIATTAHQDAAGIVLIFLLNSQENVNNLNYFTRLHQIFQHST